jgi:poly(3-hydroxybutyrate) depolymerase
MTSMARASRNRRWIALAALISLPGCLRGSADGTAARPAGSGCAEPSFPQGGTTREAVRAAGIDRTYHLVVPAGDPRRSRALVLVFHGRGGNGQEMRAGVGRALEAAAHGEALFVYPDGVDRDWRNRDGMDVAFMDALLARLSGEVCFDPRRVFATGFSSGGVMSNALGCARGGVIRGIAPMSGAGPRFACSGLPVAAWISHGTADLTIPEPAGEASRDHWIGANGCSRTALPTIPSPCVAYQGCGDNPVVWCAFAGGHDIPAFVVPAIWSFFQGLR